MPQVPNSGALVPDFDWLARRHLPSRPLPFMYLPSCQLPSCTSAQVPARHGTGWGWWTQVVDKQHWKQFRTFMV